MGRRSLRFAVPQTDPPSGLPPVMTGSWWGVVVMFQKTQMSEQNSEGAYTLHLRPTLGGPEASLRLKKEGLRHLGPFKLQGKAVG